jgi:hypothetical protein
MRQSLLGRLKAPLRIAVCHCWAGRGFSICTDPYTILQEFLDTLRVSRFANPWVFGRGRLRNNRVQSSATAESPSGAKPERSASVSKQTDHFVQPEGSTPTTLMCGSIFGRRQHQPPVSCELLAKCQHQNDEHQVRGTPLQLFSLHASSS